MNKSLHSYYFTQNYTALKNFTFRKAFFAVIAVFLFSSASAQLKKSSGHDHSSAKRCATMEVLEDMLQKDPTLPAKWKAEGERIQQQNLLRGIGNRPASPTGTTATIYVPVVFHIIGTATNQANITDLDIRRQVDVLNLDYAGLNADSVKIPAAFKPLFGHSDVQFVLARRTPAGASTNGIERRVSNATFTQGTVANIKSFAGGGLDQWDGSKYFNIWMGTFTDGLLGIATFPFMTPANQQGVVIGLSTLDNPCYPASDPYNKGRTLTHEAGHYFYLYHTFTGCATSGGGSDFGTQAGFGLNTPASTADDTPGSSAPFFGCPATFATVASACAGVPNPPGIMYQNYMDYTDDACMVMFSKNQTSRIQDCIDQYRAGLKTSDGATPVAGSEVLNDARVSEILNPDSRGFACGNVTAINTCNTSTVSPIAVLVNDGDGPLTSTTLEVYNNNVLFTTVNWTGSLASGQFVYVPLGALSLPSGANQKLTVKSVNPNGQPDGRPTGDAADATYSLTGAGALLNAPLAPESFTPTTFPPTNWSRTPASGNTWARTATAGNPGTSSARFNAYNYPAGAISYLQTPKFDATNRTSFTVNFNVAYSMYDAVSIDTLELVYQEGCDLNWKPTGYKKWATALATNGGAFVTGSFTPTTSQWRSETVTLNLPCTGGPGSLSFAFKATSGFGNNILIDNVSVTDIPVVPVNAGLASITSPVGNTCDNVVTPVVTLANSGTNTLTSITFNYNIDGGPMSTFNWTGSLVGCANASEVVTLPAIAGPTASGNHNFQVYTSNPNGVPDQAPSNDTARSNYNLQGGIPLPFTQGFDSPAFPPTGGFLVINPDGGITWARTTTAARTGAGSMRINIYNYGPDLNGEQDIFRTPNLGNNFDSILVDFDLAYAMYDGASPDSLEVVISTDCGKTFQNAGFTKSGRALATNGGTFVTANFVPTATQWRKESVAIPTCGASSIMIGLRSTNYFGNNIYIDNFAVSGIQSVNRDAATVSINNYEVLCNATVLAPEVTIANRGLDVLTSVNVNYQLDGGTVGTLAWTGSLAKCDDRVTLTLPNIPLSTGAHTLKVFTSDPNGGTDQRSGNDTLVKIFFNSPLLSNKTTPVFEGFEGTSFPPANWYSINPDRSIGWDGTVAAAKDGSKSMVINNFTYPTANTTDYFISPLIANDNTIDSMFVSFDLAYLQGYQYPGSTVFPLDTLEVLATKDCGVTYQTVWKKWGADLQTITDPNLSYQVGFQPNAARKDWKNINLYLNPFVGTDPFQVYFVAKSNKQNNLWIDNVNIYSKTLPQLLKDQGYLIYPNPSSDYFRVHHYQLPTNLRSAQVFNSAGQLVWDARYNGNAPNQFLIDLTRQAKGVYVLKMVYTNKTVVERIVKN